VGFRLALRLTFRFIRRGMSRSVLKLRDGEYAISLSHV
jgi:hypothetical protein